jgi:hypothetical protein
MTNYFRKIGGWPARLRDGVQTQLKKVGEKLQEDLKEGGQKLQRGLKERGQKVQKGLKKGGKTLKKGVKKARAAIEARHTKNLNKLNTRVLESTEFRPTFYPLFWRSAW